jgi:2-keto-4-pentenoate hydratase/2-oxohepta-3-ene-1,7-dioic acid hydratase in catechol pathway
MRIARFQYKNDVKYGLLQDEQLQPIIGDVFSGDYQLDKQRIALQDVKLLSPVTPSKLICVALNYALHAKESNKAVPAEPMIFMVSPGSIIAEGESIQLSNGTDQIDFEAEIAIIIGKRGKAIPASEARSYILGYTCSNDVSNRNLQKQDGQFTRAKSFDTYKPLGPWIETDVDPNHLDIKLWQNGEVKQSSNTNDMIFSVERLVEFISGVMTLEPGDVIITGTPSGVGPMRDGDCIEIEIEGIGRLTNYVVL